MDLTEKGFPELSIIIPCLNEEENVPEILSRLNKVVTDNNMNVETILIDDWSEDATFEVAMAQIKKYESLNLRVQRRFQPRRGYGAVVRYGLAHAIGKYCIFVSADGVDPIELLPEFLEKKRQGADLVQCNRRMNKGDDSTIPFIYKFYQFWYHFLEKILLGRKIPDSTYSFKMFNRVDLLAVGLGQNRFSISPEITFKVMLLGGTIEYIAAGQGTRTKGESKFMFRKEGIRYGYVLLRTWLHKLNLVLWF